jgi:hypothetical protein
MTAAKKCKLIAYKCFENYLLIWLVDNFFYPFLGVGVYKSLSSYSVAAVKKYLSKLSHKPVCKMLPQNLKLPPSKKCYIFNPTVSFTDLDRCE